MFLQVCKQFFLLFAAQNTFQCVAHGKLSLSVCHIPENEHFSGFCTPNVNQNQKPGFSPVGQKKRSGFSTKNILAKISEFHFCKQDRFTNLFCFLSKSFHSNAKFCKNCCHNILSIFLLLKRKFSNEHFSKNSLKNKHCYNHKLDFYLWTFFG